MTDHYPQRRSPRLDRYDYSQAGAYFVTICTHNRRCLFGSVMAQTMVLSDVGLLAHQTWLSLLDHHHASLDLDAFVVMPNHVHGIIVLFEAKHPLSQFINLYKGAVSRILKTVHPLDHPLWQRSFHDHIIRNEADLDRIRGYIVANPARWSDDSLFS